MVSLQITSDSRDRSREYITSRDLLRITIVLFFLSSLQDEKNQIINTNIWLNLVSRET